MKKSAKIFFISVLSLFAVLLLTISIILFLVFTPGRFTPIVRTQADKYLNCQSDFGKVELTFFSTFPNFGIKVSQLALISKSADPEFDTLVKADEFVGFIDLAAWWKKNELILTGLELTGGTVNVFSDSLGNTNYNIVSADSISTPGTETEAKMPTINLGSIVLKDVNLQYKDLALKLNTIVNNLSASISGTITEDKMIGDVNIKRSVVSIEYNGEKYLQLTPVTVDIPIDIIPSRQFINLNKAVASVNDLEFRLNGSFEIDSVNKDIITDLSYEFTSLPVAAMLALVPHAFNSYLKGIEADGLLSSHGSIKGHLTDSVMPMLDVSILLEKGVVKYTGFPLPVHDIEGDVFIHTDLKTDSLSFVRVKQFQAKTPLSSIRIEGIVNHLFTDTYCDLTTTAGLALDEFNPMIPDSLKVDMKGKASGIIRSAFSMSWMKKMQLEKIKLSGNVTLTDFKVDYDSISLNTDRSKIEFSLPNSKPSSKNTKFAFATIQSDNITALKIDSYRASLKNATFSIETSDARDTARIPEFICSFNMDSLSAEMDTLSVAIAKPKGKISVSPEPDKPGQPRIILSYNSEKLKSILGQNSFAVNTISIETDILNDKTQKSIYLQWLFRGFIDMNQGVVTVSGLSHPIEIPSLKMNFEPEAFNIKESIINIDKSDFQLTGNLTNISSYFRGDSILKGKFNFVSNITDIGQLMALTNGLGKKDTLLTPERETKGADSTYTGPYMVPSGIDLTLNANVKMATLGVDTATNIAGNVVVHNGVLVLDGLTFNTPAARMQLTAIYRTPRKNHIFVGIDYHMLDVEISQLLTMIPDIDSLMPMLRSFSGKGEFHIAVETYLDSLYNIKKSTLRGASSIKGNDLVLMDGETFSEIAKTLKFNKKTENKVDSLSAEFTIFRNEIDVYPFLLVMDKYKAVIAGRHNFDLTYDYHISVVDSPLPLKLGVDVKGNKDDFTFKLAKCRYAQYYRPSSRQAVQSKQLELRKLIRETLTQKVINQTPGDTQ